MSSTVQIIYDPDGSDLDITGDVLFEDATFETQMNAVPGTGSFRVKDEDRTYTFVTGREVQLWVDGTQIWGGYIRRVNRTFPFAADDTSDPEVYTKRIWLIEAVDYNILLDARIIRNTASYTTHVPNNTGYEKSTMDGWALWKLLHSFSDFPSGFGITSDRSDASFIDDVRTVLPSTSTSRFKYKSQGTPIREQFDELAKMAGAVFYISGDKKVHYHAWENVEKRWGFSDNPNWNALTENPASYQAADWGFHEVTGEEDGALITNDVIIWGGSPIGSGGNVLYKRLEDSASQNDHGRWQLGELHFNESGFGVQSGVDARANVILNGPPGAAGNGLLKGLRYSQWNFRFQWWADQVPLLNGTPDHILAGDIVRIELETFGASQFAPCRTLTITFPGLDPNGDAFVLFSGEFSFSYTDPIALWRGLLAAKAPNPTVQVVTADNTTTSAGYGDSGTFTPLPEPNGVITDFDLPSDLGYISQTLMVYINGLVQRRGIDYLETDPARGEFSLTSAPYATDELLVTCLMLPDNVYPVETTDLQELIDATSSGGTLDISGYRYAGAITIDKPMTLIGGHIRVWESAHGITVSSPDVTLDGVTVSGVGNTNQSGSGIWADQADGLYITNCNVADFPYGGIMVLRTVGGEVSYNTVERIGMDVTGAGNAYGIYVSTLTPGSILSENINVHHNVVDWVPNWHGLDTHAGQSCQFNNNTVSHCNRAIFITSDSYGHNADDIDVSGNHCSSPTPRDDVREEYPYNEVGITIVTGGTNIGGDGNHIDGHPTGLAIDTQDSGAVFTNTTVTNPVGPP